MFKHFEIKNGAVNKKSDVIFCRSVVITCKGYEVAIIAPSDEVAETIFDILIPDEEITIDLDRIEDIAIFKRKAVKEIL